MSEEKTTLYEKISKNPWDQEEWRLYNVFKENARCNSAEKLKELLISPTKYKNWVSRLDQFVLMQPAYYPGGLTGDLMGGIGKNKPADYYKIYKVLTEHPTMSIYDIALHTELSRNTVSKYLKEMCENHIIIGPHLRMKSSPDYKEYVYLMKFSDPHAAFKGLHKFPHVQYNALTFGDWNTLVITNRLLDFSRLVGFESVVYQGVKYCTYTPAVEYTTWNQSFERIHEHLCRFAPWKSEITSRLQAPSLTWGEDEWALYQVFKYDVRKKVTPTLRKIGVRYETYNK